MRVTTFNQFKQQMSLSTKQYEKISQLRRQIDTQQKLLQSSDDPVLASRIKNVDEYLDRLKGYENNLALAESRSKLFESSTQSLVDITNKIFELSQSALNGSLGNEQRVIVAKELQSNLDSILHIANTKDTNGEYIFSGISATIKPFSSLNGGGYIYNGSFDNRNIDIGPNSSKTYTESGYDVFNTIKAGNGYFTLAVNAANQGTGTSSVGSVIDFSQYASDTYTITFVTNSSGNLGYQVVGNNGGQIIPAPPATIPNNAPGFISGQDINFKGISINISGQPVAGDSFQVIPSSNQDIFTTIQNMIDILSKPINDEKDKAIFYSQLTEQRETMLQTSNHLKGYLGEIGARLADINRETKLNEDLRFNQKILRCQLADIDPVEVESDLMQRLTMLQVTQQTYAKIQEVMSDLLKL